MDYPTWLANLVVVDKHNSEWCMCIDYTDLNRAIPKKPFPLPRIDQVVDVVVGHEVLCFLDAYKGYHQILIAEEDIDKMAFVMNDSIFFYTIMAMQSRVPADD